MKLLRWICRLFKRKQILHESLYGIPNYFIEHHDHGLSKEDQEEFAKMIERAKQRISNHDSSI